MISASLDAWLRPSRTSQPKTRIMIRYSRRTDTNRDLAPTRSFGQTAAHGPCIEFWSATGSSLRAGRIRVRSRPGRAKNSSVPRRPGLVGDDGGARRGPVGRLAGEHLPGLVAL